MKIASNLKADVAEGDWKETHGILSTVLDEPSAGFFRQIQLGPAGVTVKSHVDGQMVAFGIPLQEIINIAVTAEPRLIPRPPQSIPSLS